MCLAIIALNARPDLPLLLVANRDEYHARPALPAGPWPGHPDIVAGRDLAGGGTWLGVSREGRYGLVTNYRDPRRVLPEAPSRGGLVQAYLLGEKDPFEAMQALLAQGDRYNGFNLILGDAQGAWYGSNRDPRGQPLRLPDGVHGLSNHLLDTPWPKVVRTREAVRRLLATPQRPSPQALFDIFADRRGAPDEDLPDTGIGLARERLLAPPFICSPDYGTRCTTVLMGCPGASLSLHEQQYDALGAQGGRADWRLPQDLPGAGTGPASIAAATGLSDTPPCRSF